MGKHIETDETGISDILFLQYFVRSWLDELGTAILIVYVVRPLFHLITSVAQLHGTWHAQTGNCTTDHFNHLFFSRGEVNDQSLVQHPLSSPLVTSGTVACFLNPRVSKILGYVHRICPFVARDMNANQHIFEAYFKPRDGDEVLDARLGPQMSTGASSGASHKGDRKCGWQPGLWLLFADRMSGVFDTFDAHTTIPFSLLRGTRS